MFIASPVYRHLHYHFQEINAAASVERLVKGWTWIGEETHLFFIYILHVLLTPPPLPEVPLIRFRVCPLTPYVPPRLRG